MVRRPQRQRPDLVCTGHARWHTANRNGQSNAISADTSVLLTWDAASDANSMQGYQVLRATARGGPYTQIAPFLVAGTSPRDVGLDATTYFYQVVAINGTGNPGPASSVASAAAQVGTDLPLNGTLAYESGDNLDLRTLPARDGERTIGQGRAPRFAHDGALLPQQRHSGPERCRRRTDDILP